MSDNNAITNGHTAIWVTEDNQLMATPMDNGTWSETVFYYKGEKIIPNRGVTFAYYFISFISAKRSLLIDDFTVFEFSGLIKK